MAVVIFNTGYQGRRDLWGVKNVFEPRKHLARVLVPQHDHLKSFDTPTTKLKIVQTFFVPILQLYDSFGTPEIEQQKKIQRV